MSNKLYEESSVQAIADAIRVLNGESNTYTISQMSTEIIDAIPTEEATGNPIAITDAAAYPAVDCKIDFEPTQDLHGYDKPWAGGAGKNLLNFSKTSQTIGGVTFTVNADNSITISGEATERADFYLKGNAQNTEEIVPNVGSYIISGGINSNAYIRVVDFGGSFDVIDDEPITVSSTSGKILLRVLSGTNINATFYPMIRLATETDPTFEPYSNICPITGVTSYKLNRTGKNLLPSLPNMTQEVSGVTISIQNSEITLSGTANATVLQDITLTTPFEVADGEYLHLCNNTTNSNVSFSFRNNADNAFSKSTNEINAIVAAKSGMVGETCTKLRIYVANGADSSVVVKPMIVKSSTATTYEPYTAQTFSEEFPALGKNLLDVSNAINATNVVDSVSSNGLISIKDLEVGKWSSTYIGKFWVDENETYTISASNMVYGRFGKLSKIANPSTSDDLVTLKDDPNGYYSGTLVNKDRPIQTFIPEYTGYVYIWYCSDNSMTYHQAFSTTLQIEKGSSATTYEPYTNTVYGGELDLDSGVLTVTHGIYAATGQEDIIKASTNDGFYFSCPIKASGATVSANSHLQVMSNINDYTSTKWSTFVGETNTYLFMNLDISLYPNVSAVQSFLSQQAQNGTPVQWYFKLRNSSTHQLTPHQLQMLKTDNNITANSGTVKVQYKVDLATYLQGV